MGRGYGRVSNASIARLKRKDIAMSAFLGPIHYWLYHKIQLQEKLIDSILQTAEQEGWNTLSAEKLNTACGASDMRPLEEIIDQGNIHGWLHQRIGVSEGRLAYLVTELLKADASRLDILKRSAYQFGVRHALANDINAKEAFKSLEDMLLNGMPCDHVNRILEQDADRVFWQQTQCVHHEFWHQAGGDILVYYELRTQIIKGMFAHSTLKFQALEDNKYEIIRG